MTPEEKLEHRRAQRRVYGKRYYAKCMYSKRWRFTQYGLTWQEAQERFDRQEGKCDVCRRAITLCMEKGGKSTAFLDHDHFNGKARGFVCAGCNNIVAALESPHRTQAEAYVDKWLSTTLTNIGV